MANPTIRRFRDTDSISLIEVFRDSVRVLGRRDYTLEQVLAWAPEEIDAVKFGARASGRPTWVAELEGRIAGFVDLGADGEIDMLYVHPAFERRGIGTVLLKWAESEAKLRRLPRLYGNVSATARKVFERCGFAIVAPQMVERNGEVMLNYRMEKSLS